MFIDKHYAEDIDLNLVTGEAYFSKFHFIRTFKHIYGYTPNRYLAHVRIEKAKLLLEKNHTVAETCIMVGFESETSFASLFRRFTGFTPSQYRHRKQLERLKVKNAPLSFIPNCFSKATL